MAYVLYARVLGRCVEQVVRVLPRVRQEVKRPQVFAIGELERLFTIGCLHPRHRTFLMTIYGAGLRLNKACHLKPEHILSERQQIRVVQGKVNKDRYTLLSPRLLEELRWYWKVPAGALVVSSQKQLKAYRAEIEKRFGEHPDHDVFGSLPGAENGSVPQNRMCWIWRAAGYPHRL